MRKLIFGIILLGASVVMAQSPISPGEKQLNAGVGISGWGTPIYVGVDFGVAKDFSVGPQLSYRNYNNNNFGGVDYNTSITVIGLTGNYHFDSLLDLPSDFNIYAGLHLGYYIWNYPDNWGGGSASGLGLDLQVGARYFFSESFGLNLEFGGGQVSGGKFGITKKF